MDKTNHDHDHHHHKYLNRGVWNGPDNTLDSVGDERDGVGQVGQDHSCHDGDPQLCSIPGGDNGDVGNGDNGE